MGDGRTLIRSIWSGEVRDVTAEGLDISLDSALEEGLVQDIPVVGWIGQISRDIGVRFSSKTVVTHQIDPEVDEARTYLVQDLVLSGGVVKIGWVTSVGQAAIATPRFNYTGDPYYTDGVRVVLLMGEQHVSLGDIQFFPWGDPRHGVPQASRPVAGRRAGPHELSPLRPSAAPEGHVQKTRAW